MADEPIEPEQPSEPLNQPVNGSKRSTKRRGRGEGSVYQRGEDGLWVGEIVIGRTATGKRRKKVVYATTKAELLKKVEKVKQKYLLDGTQDGGQMMVKNCLTFWLDTTIKAKVSGPTYDRYRTIVEVHLKPRIGHYRMSELTGFKIGQLYRDLEEAAVGKTVLNHCGKRLRQFMGHCVCFGIVPTNEALKIPIPKYTPPEKSFLTVEEVGRLLVANRDHRLYALLVLAVDSGARIGELLALKWTDVDWDRSEVSFLRTVYRIPRGGVAVKESKTPKSKRRVLLTSRTMAVLREYHAKETAKKRGTDLIFPNRKNTHYNPGSILTHHWPGLLRAAGLSPDLTPHCLRHTAASLLLMGYGDRKPAHIKVVSERLGHSSVEITLRTYTHLIPGLQSQAVEVMDSVFDDAMAHSKTTVVNLPSSPTAGEPRARRSAGTKLTGPEELLRLRRDA